jgi:hypothetical protein
MRLRTKPNALLLMPAAALVVHQARYSLAYGARANAELTATGHSYLHSLVPWTIFALGVGASMFLRRVARASRTGRAGTLTGLSTFVLWSLTTTALLAIYAVQEVLEELSISGHPDGMAGVFGHGGWWALPAAAAVALGVVALLRLGRAVLRLASRLGGRPQRTRRIRVRLPSSVALVAPAPLALAQAGRAPPPRRA